MSAWLRRMRTADSGKIQPAVDALSVVNVERHDPQKPLLVRGAPLNQGEPEPEPDRGASQPPRPRPRPACRNAPGLPDRAVNTF